MRLRTKIPRSSGTAATLACRQQNQTPKAPTMPMPTRSSVTSRSYRSGSTTMRLAVPTAMSAPMTSVTTRASRGRNGAYSWFTVVQRSQAARVDRGHEDRAGADVVERVHDLVGLVAAHHDPHGRPLLVVQRGYGRRLEARGDGDRAVNELEGYVVV